MKTLQTAEAAARPNHPAAGAGSMAPLQNVPGAAMDDSSAAALTLQRFRKMTDTSHRALQLKQLAETVASSPAAMALQRLQHAANGSPQALQLKQAEMVAASAPGGLQGKPVVNQPKAAPGIVQRNVDVGGTIYKAYDRKGHTPDDLVRDIRAEAENKSVRLKGSGWQNNFRELARDKATTTTYANWDEIIDLVKADSKNEKRKRQIEDQDADIANLLTGVSEPTKKRARMISYESGKALESVRKHIRTTDEYTETMDELEALAPAEMGGKNEVEATENSAYVFEALDQSDDMMRMDFNFHDTPIVTHGYESMDDRTKDASTLNPFSLGPIKIGKDIGSYRQALKRRKNIRGHSNRVLTNLEMFRIPETSAMLGLKRDLYEQGQIPLEEAIAADSLKSNVEFVGAVKGSGLTADQKRRMQQQQVFSNAHILDDYATRFPNYEIGTQTKDLKPRTTPSKIKGAQDQLEKDKDKAAKKALRRKLKRATASVMDIDNYDSGSDVSDYDEAHYT